MTPIPNRIALVLVPFLLFAGCAPDAPPESTSPSASPGAGAKTPAPGPATAGEPPIRYELRFDPPRHFVDVSMRLPAEMATEVFLPAWTPGSYKIRDYAKHLEGLTAHALVEGEAQDGEERPLEVRKITKDRWRVDVGESAGDVVLRYRLYARERTVRTNWVDADLAMLNGAPTFLAPAGADDVARSVRLVLPEEWSDAAVALDPHPSGGRHHFVAPDLDTLVDSPIIAGDLLRLPFSIEHEGRAVPHEVIHVGDIEGLDLEWSRGAVEILTRAHVDFWGDVPYERYLFLNVVAPASGGLEHADSTLMLTSRWGLVDEEAGEYWLGLVSHELFHTWNGKRLRPVTLGPFDYTKENYVDTLGVVEGFTSYYGPLLLRRSGLWSEDDLLAALSRSIRDVETTPGRQVRSLADASFDAWIKHYQRDENHDNTAVDYYSKGAVVAWILDAAIRRETGGRQSLDACLRRLDARFSGETGYRAEDVRAALVETGGETIGTLWDRLHDSTEEIDYAPALEHFGLRLGAGGPDERGWLGFEAERGEEALVVAEVPRDTPAFEFGLNVGDEILAVDDRRVTERSWDDRRTHWPPGTEATLLVARDGRVREIEVVFGVESAETWNLERDPEAGIDARTARRMWW